MEILHTCLNVSDAERAVEFYTSQLGFEETWSFESADGRTTNRYVAGDGGVELQLSETEGQDAPSAGELWDHVALEVEDVDAAFGAIDDPDVVDGPSDQPPAGARTAKICDPDGHVVELVQPLA